MLPPGRLCIRAVIGTILLAILAFSAFAEVPDAPFDREDTHRGNIGRPDSLYLHYKEQLNVAIELKKLPEQGRALSSMADVCFHMGQYAQALEYYLEANNLFREQGMQPELAHNFLDLGILRYYNRNIPDAEREFRQALQLYRKIGDHRGIARAYGNIGFSFEKRKFYDSARAYQLLALREYDLAGDPLGKAKIFENIGSIHEDLEEYDSAMVYFNRSLEQYRLSGEKVQQIEVVNNIGDVYRKTGRYREGLVYSLEATRLSHEANELYQLSSGYRDIAKTYNLLGQNDSAFQYLDLSRKYLLEIYSKENSTQMAFLEAQNDAYKKNQEIARLQNAERVNLVITVSVIVVIVLLIAVGVLVLRQQKQKIHSERSINEQNREILEARNLLVEADLKAATLEEEKLKSQLLAQELERGKLDADLRTKTLEETLLREQIEVRTKELSTNALHVIQKNQLLDELKSGIEALVEEDKRDQKRKLKQLLALINQNFNNESYWTDFRTSFEQVHQSFFEELKKVAPDLSASELRLVSLLKMNMSSTDMATMLGISPDSLRVARHRLRKKLNLEQGGNLVAFLQSL